MRNMLMLVLAALLPLLAGCGGGGGGGGNVIDVLPIDAPPVIASTRVVVPQGLTFLGGDISIQANVTDDHTLSQVTAVVAKVDQPLVAVSVPLTLQSGTTYSGTFAAPAYLGVAAEGQGYFVQIVAVDNAGHSTSSSADSFVVPAAVPGGLPPPPF